MQEQKKRPFLKDRLLRILSQPPHGVGDHDIGRSRSSRSEIMVESFGESIVLEDGRHEAGGL
jgi:hypothetical protein